MWEFIIDNIWSILGLLVGILGVVAGVIFKRPKVANMLKSWSKVLKSVPNFIRQAEKMTNDPIEKHAYVLNQVCIHFQAEGYVATQEQLDEASAIIVDQVQLSKDINKDSKNSPNTATTTTIATIKPLEPIGGVANEEN